MKLYFIGIAMRDYRHDYSELHALLSAIDAQRVSNRIWLGSVGHHEGEMFRQIGRSLSVNDELLIVEVPKDQDSRPAIVGQGPNRSLPAPSGSPPGPESGLH